MAGEGIQNYVDMAAGLKEVTKAKARAAAQSLLATAGLEDVAADATDRVGKLAEEVIAASKANRELMGKLVAAEVDKAAGRLGFVRSEELDELRREMAELRMSMAHAAAHEPPDPGPFAPDLGVPDPPVSVDLLLEPDDPPLIEPIEPPVRPAKKTAKKTAAKKTATKKPAPARKTATAAKATTAATTPLKTAANKTAVKKSPTVAKATARKTPAVTKAAARKTAATKPPGSGA